MTFSAKQSSAIENWIGTAAPIADTFFRSVERRWMDPDDVLSGEGTVAGGGRFAAVGEYNGDALTRLAMKLMAYTFVRTSEEIEAPWTEFNLDEARWVIPPERMKMDTPHVVPLARQAVDVLRALKLLTGSSKYILPGAIDKNKPMSNNTILYALYRLGYRGRMTGHGFRGWHQRFCTRTGLRKRTLNCSWHI